MVDYEEKLAAMGQKPEGDLLSELDKFKEATGYEEWLDIDPAKVREGLENPDTAHIDEMLAFAEKAEQAYAAEAEAFVQTPKDIVEQARAVHGEPDTFSIYQLKSGDETLDYRFEPLDSIHRNGLSVKPENYELVYQAPPCTRGRVGGYLYPVQHCSPSRLQGALPVRIGYCGAA